MTNSINDLDALLAELAGPTTVKPKPKAEPAAPRRDDWQPPALKWDLFEVKDFFEAQICEECGHTNRVFGSRTLGYAASHGASHPHRWVRLAPYEVSRIDFSRIGYSTETVNVRVPICHHCSRMVEAAQLLTNALKQSKQLELF